MGQGLHDNLPEADQASLEQQAPEQAKIDRADVLLDGLEDFMAKFLNKDLARTIALGVVQGTFKDKAEMHHEVAKNMLQKGYAPASISKMTGLSEAEINKVQQSIDEIEQEERPFLKQLSIDKKRMDLQVIVGQTKALLKVKGMARMAVQLLQEGWNYRSIEFATQLSITEIDRLESRR